MSQSRPSVISSTKGTRGAVLRVTVAQKSSKSNFRAVTAVVLVELRILLYFRFSMNWVKFWI